MLNDPNLTEWRPVPLDAAARRTRGDQGMAQIIVTALLVVVAFVAGWFGNALVNRPNYVAPQVANNKVNNEYLVTQAWDAITNHYVVTSAIDQKQMAYAAIQAMVNTLNDPGHSRFETAEEFAQEQNQLNNAPSVGIGVYLSGGGSQPLRIDAIIPGAPASKGNVKPGDEIVAVDGKSIKGLTFEQARPLITGQKGTTVTLTLIRPSVSPTATFDVPLVRADFTAPTVVSYLIPQTGIDDIQLTDFSGDADAQLKKALKDAQAQHVKGIILDLRGNPGGFLDQAVKVVSEFIPSGPGKNVLIEKTRTGQMTDAAVAGGLATSTPLAILVDHDTASAAEITAGAIKVNRPTVQIIGQPTFGTGTVLNNFPLADGSQLILGTEEFLLPNGVSIYHKGLTQDQQLLDQVVALPQNVVPVSPLTAQEEKLSLAQIQQSRDTQLLQALHALSGS